MDLSFVILTWNSAEYLERCLEAIAAALDGGDFDYEILVLDNGSTDGTAALLQKREAGSAGRIRALYEAENLGTTRSRNRLLRTARGRLICVMDSDVELAPGVVEELAPLLERDPTVGIAAPRIVYPSGAWQKSFDRFPTLFDKVNRFFRLRTIEAREAREPRGHAHHVDYAISAFWLMRRDVLDKVGFLDERIFYAPEDVDFCLRVWRAGLSVVYVPSVTVVHHTQEISRGFKINKAKWLHLCGLAYYFRKHGYLFRRPRFSEGGVGAVALQGQRRDSSLQT